MTTITEESTLTKRQLKHFGPKFIDYFGEPSTFTVEVRFDDECGNGHNSFAITGEIRPRDHRKKDYAGGCIHEEIAKHFPELEPLIKWHLCSTDGPMHYVANTVWHAGDADCWHHRKGEPSAFEYGVRFNGVPLTHRIGGKFWKFLQERKGTGDFQVFALKHEDRPGESYKFKDHYSFIGFAEKWHEAPFSDRTAAEEFCKAINTCSVEFVKVETEWSEGKVRELDAARHSAIWPEATDEELTAPGLEDRLKARLPKLLADFRAAVESLGFTW